MGAFTILSYLNKISLLAFFITAGFLFYQVYLLKKESTPKAGKPVIPDFDENIKVAHKYGRELHIVNDAGIVFSQKPYVVVIMSKGVVDEEADQAFPQLSKIIYEAETGGN